MTHPAILSAVASPAVSKRYSFISTHEIIERVTAEGFEVASARAAKPRTRQSQFTGHEVRLNIAGAEPIQGAVPQVILLNSHDGSTSLRAMAGVFRFVCSNGLVVGNTVGKVAQRHQGVDSMEAVLERIRGLARETHRVYGTIERFSRVDLSTSKAREFARLAAQLRWGDAARYEPDEMLQVRRAGDDAGDLWSVFNRVQESAVRGGLQGLLRNGRAATSRPIGDIHRDVDFNADLWTLAEEFAEIAA